MAMGWIRRAAALLHRARLSKDHADELEFHLAMREQLNVDQGMPAREARRAARLRFGNAVSWRERMREVDLLTFPGSVWQDIRYGSRMLAKHKGFTAIAVLALALGIGLNTATFTAYKAIVLRTLDARDPARMVNISLIHLSGDADPMFSYPDYLAYRDQTRSFDGVIAASGQYLTLSGAGGAVVQSHSVLGVIAGKFGFVVPSMTTTNAEIIRAEVVSENYFSVLGMPAAQGRLFDSLKSSELLSSPAVLISENYWKRRFGSEPEILGKSIRLNGLTVTIIGVTPHNFVGTGIAAPDVWVPISLESLLHTDANPLRDRENQFCRIFARLAPGVTMMPAQAEVESLADQLRSLHDPHSDLSKPLTAQVWPGSPFGRKPDASLRFAILLIMIAVGMVLVIACANVASLQLARAAARQNELGMRLSLGASRGRIIRQLLTESALLGLLSGVVALLFTWGLLHVVATELADALPPEWGSLVLRVTPDMQVFAYVFSISLFAGILFGLAPALESSRSALSSSFKANKETSPSRGGRLRDVMIGAQVAICLVLMIAGSLLIRGSIHAVEMDTGYDGKHVINVEINFPDGAKYNKARQLALLRQIRARVEGLPGVASATVGRPPDGGGVRVAAIWLNGDKPMSGSPQQIAFYTYVLPSYFETLGIPLLAGRGFQAQSGVPEPSVILSQSQAAQLWPGQNPIGRALALDTANQFHTKSEMLPDKVSYQVVGVVRDSRGVQLDSSDNAQIYLQLPADRIDEHPMLVRTQSDPTALIGVLGAEISSVDPNLVAYTSTLDALLRETGPFVVSRSAAAFASIVGGFGLLLASMGIYGTVNYMVVLRTREVGIRMALGASRGSVLRLILQQSTRPVVAGLGVGLVLAAGVSRLLHTLLYGLGAVDVVSFASVSILFLAIALLAAYVPSRGATRVDPVIALRYE
jgi:predicted permease